MLRISKKSDYAVFLMGYLARNAPAGADRVVSAQEIADHSGLHKSVVANLLKELTKASLLASVRGIRGGYRLAKPAAEISLGNILEVVEGPFVLVDCANGDAREASPGDEHYCSLMSFCPSKQPMRVLHGRIALLMHELRLPELIADMDACPQHHDSAFLSSDATTAK